MSARISNYDKFPFVAVSDARHPYSTGWDNIAAELQRAIGRGRLQKPILVVDCYPGVDELAVLNELKSRLAPKLAIHAEEACHPPEKIEKLVAPFLNGDDPAFGRFSSLSLVNFFNAEPLWRFRRTIDELKEGLVLIVGCGASLIAWGHILVCADLARGNAQQRLLRNETGNLCADNKTFAAHLKYKRAFFVDWPVADRWKRPLIKRWEYVLDTNNPAEPKLADADDVRAGLREVVTRPFRLVPRFNHEPWGRQVTRNFSHGLRLDCAPEENSLLLGFGDARLEIPAMELLHHHARALLGEAVQSRFGDVFPIRVNILDTMDTGDERFQVHPRPEYLRQRFGLRHVQDENYYLLDAAADARVHLGLREGIALAAMQSELEIARSNNARLPEVKYTDQFPAKTHDHFLIPAGTVHGTGPNSTVLQISATPYIFPFELWNWDTLGLNGKLHPLHRANDPAKLHRKRDTIRARENLVNRVAPIASGDGWREESVGLCERNFIELRRHWFTKKVLHDTHDGVNVLNLVAGEEAVVESPADAFAPFVVHYSETFIVPAAVGEYTIRPHGPSVGRECATIKAFIRTGAWD